MHSPAVLNRVRVNGREDEFIIVWVDHLARVADICSLFDQTAIERSVPFDLLSAKCESEATKTDYCPHDQRIASIREVMRGSVIRLRESHGAVSHLQQIIQETLEMIRSSQKLIVASDKVIYRAQCGSIDTKPKPVPIP